MASFSVKFQKYPNYLHAIVRGENARDTIDGYLASIRNECARQDCYRVLIESKLSGPRLSDLEIFEIIIERGPELAEFFEALAYYDANQSRDTGAFTETAAVNRGIPLVIFQSMDDAHAWLASGKKTGPDSSQKGREALV